MVDRGEVDFDEVRRYGRIYGYAIMPFDLALLEIRT
jgi:hypothetical protein